MESTSGCPTERHSELPVPKSAVITDAPKRYGLPAIGGDDLSILAKHCKFTRVDVTQARKHV
jgi:hypothetical protein